MGKKIRKYINEREKIEKKIAIAIRKNNLGDVLFLLKENYEKINIEEMIKNSINSNNWEVYLIIESIEKRKKFGLSNDLILAIIADNGILDKMLKEKRFLNFYTLLYAYDLLDTVLTKKKLEKAKLFFWKISEFRKDSKKFYTEDYEQFYKKPKLKKKINEF